MGADGGAKLGRLLKRGRARRVAPAGLYPPWGASARPLGWRLGGPAGPGVPAGTGPTFNGCCPLLPCWDPHCSTASRVCARRSRPATHPAGAIYASPRFFSCCRAPPSRASNSVWARPLTVPCFLGTAQQGRKGHNTMYITGNAAVATAVANYRRSLALASMAMANYQVLLNYASDHKRLPPERLRATWRGCITLRNQLQANADAALAVGGITWEEHQAAYRI